MKQPKTKIRELVAECHPIYIVRGNSGTYQVDQTHETYPTCSCRGFKFNRTCGHIAFVRELMAARHVAGLVAAF